MSFCEYEKDGIITDVYGRFAIGIGFNMTGRILIRPDSLCLKLKTGWIPRKDPNASKDGKKGVFGGGDNNGGVPPNLAKILTIGDRITFDAMQLSHPSVTNGSSGGIRWVAAPGSVRVVEVCTRTKIYTGYANVIELTPLRGVLAFADKRICFDPCATFPKQANDLTREYRLGDMAAFVAMEQSEATGNCQWRAISVERYSLHSAPPPPQVSPPFTPSRSKPQTPFEPIDFLSDSSPKQSPSSPHSSQSSCPPCIQELPSPRPTLFSQDPSRHVPRVGPIGQGRDRQPPSQQIRNRSIPDDFDLRMYTALPERLTGHGRVSYKGPKCSMIKDLAMHHKVFFYNMAVVFPRGVCRKPLGEGAIVHFEAERTTQRANLRAFYEAKRVTVLDERDQRRWNSHRQDSADRGESTQGSPTDSSVSSRTTSPRDSGDDQLSGKRAMESCSMNCGETSTKRKRSRWDEPGNNEKLEKPQMTIFDARQRIQQRAAKGKEFEVDREPFDDKIDRVRFDRKPSSFGQIEERNEDSYQKTETDGNKRKCVLRSSIEDDMDLDEFMKEQEDAFGSYEFMTDENDDA